MARPRRRDCLPMVRAASSGFSAQNIKGSLVTWRPNIGLQRTARLRLAAAEAGSLGCEVELGR
jgi:hypothetical protein